MRVIKKRSVPRHSCRRCGTVYEIEKSDIPELIYNGGLGWVSWDCPECKQTSGGDISEFPGEWREQIEKQL